MSPTHHSDFPRRPRPLPRRPWDDNTPLTDEELRRVIAQRHLLDDPNLGALALEVLRLRDVRDLYRRENERIRAQFAELLRELAHARSQAGHPRRTGPLDR